MLMDAATLAAVAQCVDERGTSVAWGEASNGFCRTERVSENADLRQRATRQFVAVLANLCASHANMASRSGNRFGLGADAPLAWSANGTVGHWASAVDNELSSLQGASLRSAQVKVAYRRIIEDGWRINHGEGMNVSCPAKPDDDGDDESLVAALGSDDMDASDLTPVAMPNPFKSLVGMSFSVSDAGGANVEMSVFDVAGRRMASLARGWYGVGSHVVQWDGRGVDGTRARAGMYFVRGRIGRVEVATSILKIE